MTDTTEDYKQISIYWLKKENLLRPDNWTSGNIVWKNDQFTVWYSLSTKPDDMYINLTHGDLNYRVELVTTLCHLGGVRFWFICPLVRDDKPCGRRVGVLYKAGKYFGCRHCYGLQYHSQSISYRKSFYAAIHVLEAYDRINKSETHRQWYAGKPTRHNNASNRLWQRSLPYIKQLK
jgi:hypothetical protein